MNGKPINNRAWFFVLPVLAFVLFSSIIPVMTVVNYSIQDTMGANNFFWNGDGWFRLLFSSLIILIPLTIRSRTRWARTISSGTATPGFAIS